MMVEFECFACDSVFESAAIRPCPKCGEAEDVFEFDPVWWDYDGSEEL